MMTKKIWAVEFAGGAIFLAQADTAQEAERFVVEKLDSDNPDEVVDVTEALFTNGLSQIRFER